MDRSRSPVDKPTPAARAGTTAAWLDWLPDFSVTVRRQVEQKTDTDLSAPRWRLDFEAQVALSLQKLSAIGAARAAQAKSQAELGQTAYAARVRALSASLELYFTERKAALLRDQIGALESLASELTHAPRAGLPDDSVLVEGYVGELRGTLAEVELEQHDSAQRLAATLEVPLEATDIDPRLSLPLLLQSIRAELGASSARVAQIRRADTELEAQRLRWTESQTWYVPEFRSTTLAQLPQGNGVDSSSSSFRLTGITTELALGVRLRPGVPALQAAQRRAIARSRFDAEQSRWLREQTEDRACTRLEALSRLWLDEAGVRTATTELDDALRRFARGERSVAELAAASRRLLAAQLARELILQEAVLSQIALSANDRTDLSASGQAARQELAPAEGRSPLTSFGRQRADREERARRGGTSGGSGLGASAFRGRPHSRRALRCRSTRPAIRASLRDRS